MLRESIMLPSIKFICMLTVLALPFTAQASTYYNCANSDGCQPVKSIQTTSTYTKSQYPIVLQHGLVGWTNLFGFMDYFYGIPQELMAGGSDVYATKVASLNDTRYRGEQLLQQVKIIRAITGKDKVNLIGHSHGGIDIRYVAGVAPEYVASVTAVSSPEQGSKMADWTIKMVVEGSAKQGLPAGEFNTGSKLALEFFNFVGRFMDVGSGVPLNRLNKQDGWQALTALSTDYAIQFNRDFSAAMPSSYCGYPPKDYKVNGVRYYSFSGVGTITNGFDPFDYVLALTSKTFGDEPNDGLVSVCSSRLGKVIREDYRMNHLDSVNQLIGMTAWGEVSPVSIYRLQVNRLVREENSHSHDKHDVF